MTGRELIEEIKRLNAEDMQVVIQYRDGGGDYYGGEILEDVYYARFKGSEYNVDIHYMDEEPNCIVL